MQFGQDHGNILALIDLLLCLPASSSDVERGFSQLKLIKANLRSTMTQETLNDLMTIKLHSGKIDEFDPVPFVEFWAMGGARSRRPLLMDEKKGKSTGLELANKADENFSDTDSDISATEEAEHLLLDMDNE